MKYFFYPTPLLCLFVCTASTPALAESNSSESLQIFGRLNVSLESFDSSAAANGRSLTVNRLSNNRSVLGFRGSEDLGNGLKAVFQIEGTVSPDTGAGAIAQRDTRIGLDGPWGTLFVGHWTAAYNNATSGLDPYYPTTAGYMSIMGNGSASSSDNVTDTASFDRRQANSVHYWTRPWNGLSLRLTHGLNEEKPANGARPSMTSVAAIAEKGPWYGVLAYERHRDYQGPGLDDHASKAALAYQFAPGPAGQIRVAVIAERIVYQTPTGELARNDYYMSINDQFGPHGLHFGIARAEDGKGPSKARIGFMRSGPDTGATHATLGYDYTLSKRTALYVYYTYLKNDANGLVDFAINSLGATAGAIQKGAALGMRHNF
jgi:predicted porin